LAILINTGASPCTWQWWSSCTTREFREQRCCTASKATAHKQIHTARILDLSGDLPVVVVAVDLPEKIKAVLPKIDEMIGQGLVTTEEARIVLSRPPL
jgi:hypothetical protein